MSDVYTALDGIFKLAFSAIPGTWFLVVVPFVGVVAFIKFIRSM